MAFTLNTLRNSSNPRKGHKIVGRGTGCKRGKTCGRGHGGMGARSGCKRRLGYIGGGVPLHKRVPTRGFSNAQFQKRLDVINLGQIEALYSDGETVSIETLREKNFIKGKSNGIKILGKGALTKKVIFKVEAMSQSAREKTEAK